MGKLIAGLLLMVVVGFGATVGFLTFAQSDPSTEVLDSDLSAIRSQIAQAEKSSERYSGGLVKALIELRLEVFRTTEAMLEQKRSALIRRIDLQYNVDGQIVRPNSERLAKIESDIAEAKSKLAESEAKAALYSGGLVKAFALTSVATNHLTISQLYLSYYGEKYGLPLPLELKLNRKDQKPEELLGTVVQDRDAL